MATKKTTGTKSSGRTSKTTKTSKTTNKEAQKKIRQKKENSKKITDWIFYITIGFFIFVCYMMYKTEDLSSVEYLADVLKGALMIGIPAYMYRAVMTDKMEVELKYTEEVSKMKKTYGDDFVFEKLDDPEFLSK